MSNEVKVLASCLVSRPAWVKVTNHLEQGDFSEKGRVILEAIGDYYERDSKAEECDSELIYAAISRKVASPKHQQAFRQILDDVGTADTSPANVVSDFIGTKAQAVRERLAAQLAQGEPALDLTQSYLDLAISEEVEEDAVEALSAPSLVTLLEDSYNPENLIRILPEQLNTRLGGGLLRGHHMIAFARTEMGKTAMAVNWCYGWLQQGLRVLYCGNEEPEQEFVLRLATRMLEAPKVDVLENLASADETMRRQHGYGNFNIFPMAPGTLREIEEEVRKTEPDVLLVDQLRNLNMKEDSFTMQLDKAARGIRAIGKRHNLLAVSITQAGDSARGKSILDDGDVDYSNTGVPGACDVLLGLGATREDVEVGRRVMSLIKNKPGDNHENFPVLLDTPFSRIRGVV